jgi:hypothetical protein
MAQAVYPFCPGYGLADLLSVDDHRDGEPSRGAVPTDGHVARKVRVPLRVGPSGARGPQSVARRACAGGPLLAYAEKSGAS